MPILPGNARTMKDDALINRLVALCKQRGSESDINVLAAEVKNRLADSRKAEQLTLPNRNATTSGQTKGGNHA